MIDILADYLDKYNMNNSIDLNLAIISVIACAAKFYEIPEKGLQILNNNINSNDPRLRSKSYKGLR